MAALVNFALLVAERGEEPERAVALLERALQVGAIHYPGVGTLYDNGAQALCCPGVGALYYPPFRCETKACLSLGGLTRVLTFS